MNNKATNIFLLVFSQAINFVLLFLFTPYLVRVLPKSVFGTYSQVLLVSEFIAVLVSIAIIQIAMMVFTNPEKHFEDSLKTVIVFTFFTGLVGVAVVFGFSYFSNTVFDNDQLGRLLRIYAIALIGSRFNLVLNQAMIRIDKARFLVYYSIISNLIKLTLAYFAINYFKSIEYFLVIYALEPIIGVIAQSILLFRNKYLSGKFRWNILHEILVVAFPLYLVEILGSSYTYIAGFVIGIYLNEEKYAIYRNGSIELPVIGTIYGTISTVFMADFSKSIYEKKYLQIAEIKKKIITTTSLIIFPIAIYFVFFSKEFIVLYMSEKYFESYKVFMIFSLALLVRFQNYTDVLVLLKKSKYVLISFVVFLVINLSLNLVLSKQLGVLGCAFATIFSVYVLAFMQLHITIRQLDVKYSDYLDLKKMGTILGLSVLINGLFKLITIYAFSSLLIKLVFSFTIAIPTLYFILIKIKIIDLNQFENLFNKIPFVGKKLFNLLK